MMPLAVNRTTARAKAVRDALAQLPAGSVGFGLDDEVLAKLMVRAGRDKAGRLVAALTDLRAAGLAADCLQVRPRPAWVERIAGAHPDDPCK